jgi:hypothetical protein
MKKIQPLGSVFKKPFQTMDTNQNSHVYYNMPAHAGLARRVVQIIILQYKYYVSEHYPSSCLYLKTPSCLFFKTQSFGDWILSRSSGKTYSVGGLALLIGPNLTCQMRAQ